MLLGVLLGLGVAVADEVGAPLCEPVALGVPDALGVSEPLTLRVCVCDNDGVAVAVLLAVAAPLCVPLSLGLAVMLGVDVPL